MIHDIDPIFLSLGDFHIYWYGIMYLIAFLMALLLGNLYIKNEVIKIDRHQFSDLLFYCFLGVFIGGRLGYSLFYNLSSTLDNPLTIFYLWNGGMSFHGGFFGVLVSIIYFSKKNKVSFFLISDFIVKLAPIGLFTGRIGNFINGELWGKPTDLAWGVVFPKIDGLPRHPSQIYEAFFEGVVLFLILNFEEFQMLYYTVHVHLPIHFLLLGRRLGEFRASCAWKFLGIIVFAKVNVGTTFTPAAEEEPAVQHFF